MLDAGNLSGDGVGVDTDPGDGRDGDTGQRRPSERNRLDAEVCGRSGSAALLAGSDTEPNPEPANERSRDPGQTEQRSKMRPRLGFASAPCGERSRFVENTFRRPGSQREKPTRRTSDSPYDRRDRRNA